MFDPQNETSRGIYYNPSEDEVLRHEFYNNEKGHVDITRIKELTHNSKLHCYIPMTHILIYFEKDFALILKIDKDLEVKEIKDNFGYLALTLSLINT